MTFCVERSFDGQEDVTKLPAFLAAIRRQGAQAGTFQYGDLMYEMYHPLTGFEAEHDIRIWEGAEGRLCGFAFFRTPDNPEFFLRPELYGSLIEGGMIQWALARATARGVTSIETSCLARDAAKAAFLRRHGFAETDDICVLLERSLAEPLTTRRLPEGYSIVTLAERPECACGIPDSGMERELYRHVQSAPGYKADLDVRAFCNSTELVSGCTVWYDDLDNCGHLQPVGTKEEHRRKGLATAVIGKAMENLRRCGADRILVWTDRDHDAAVRLYRSLGFQVMHKDYAWTRRAWAL